MSNEDEDLNSAPPKKAGMNTSTKVLLVALSIGGILMLLCCGGALVGMFFLGRTIQNSIVTNPATVQELTQEMVSVDVPEGFEPKQGMNMEMFGMKMVIYNKKDDPQTVVMFMQNRMGFDANNEEQREQMLSQMRMQMGMQSGMSAKETETREIEIDGERIPFQFNKIDQNGKSMRQVIGFVPLKTGVIMVMIMLPEDSFDEEQVITMLQSIRAPASVETEIGPEREIHMLPETGEELPQSTTQEPAEGPTDSNPLADPVPGEAEAQPQREAVPQPEPAAERPEETETPEKE